MSYRTVISYLGDLKSAFLVRALEPFHAKLNKGLVSPNVYWRALGALSLAHGVNGYESLIGHAWVGQSWGFYVIE